MSVLHPDVARRKFAAVADEIVATVESLRDACAVAHVGFPFVGLHVLDPDGRPALGLRINAENWPFRALSFTVTSLDFLHILPPEQIPRPEGSHLFWNANRGQAWFCVQGTDEFHTFYAGAVPWTAVRHQASNGFRHVLRDCLAQIDRARLRGPSANAQAGGAA